MTAPNRTPAPGEAATPDLVKRYNFLLGFLIERGVLTDKRYHNGTWSLQGIYGVDDSGLRGAGRTPEEALDNAIVAVNLEPTAARKFWSDTHAALATQPAQGVQAAGEAVPGAVWFEGSVSLINRGREDDFCERRPAQRIYFAAPTVADRVPLTEGRLKTIDYEVWRNTLVDTTKWDRQVAFARAIEAAHGIHDIGAEKTA